MTISSITTSPTRSEVQPIRSRLDYALAIPVATAMSWSRKTRAAVSDRIHNRDDAGMTTAEYAVGILAAVAFAGVLLLVVRDASIQKTMTKLIVDALKK